MKPEIIQKLLEINHRFYLEFGPAFASTRRRIQPGVDRILQTIPSAGDWLDLGCGSGALAARWVAMGFKGSYTGLDNSPALLDEARRVTGSLNQPGFEITYRLADLADQDWDQHLKPPFDGVMAFAALHHIPGVGLRGSILSRIHGLIKTQGLFIHSEWQLQHSPRLNSRRLDWEIVGLNRADVEEGDILIDWRYSLPGQAEKTGVRYVHLFNQIELSGLAEGAGFEIVEEFESDGAGGRLGLYQVWRAS